MIYYTRYVKKYVCFWKNRHVTAITSIYVTAAVCQTEAANLWHCSFRSRLWLGELGVQRLTDRMNFPCFLCRIHATGNGIFTLYI